jgi:small-conductance mechanosensitive channel
MEIQDGTGLSPWSPAPKPEPEGPSRRMRATLWVVRYGISVAFLVAGVAISLIAWNVEGLIAGSMFIGAAIAVWALNFFFRVGVHDLDDREREADARAYFDRHGRWPGE